jgi:hypothetical protein
MEEGRKVAPMGLNCKVHPITGHEGPESEQSNSPNLSLTSTLIGVGVQPHPSAALPPVNRPATQC